MCVFKQILTGAPHCCFCFDWRSFVRAMNYVPMQIDTSPHEVWKSMRIWTPFHTKRGPLSLWGFFLSVLWLIVLLLASRQLSEWPLVKMSWIKTYFSLEDRPATAAASPICIVAYVDMGLGWRYVRQIGLSRFLKKLRSIKLTFTEKLMILPRKSP